MVLTELKTGEKGIITKVKGRGAFRKRIIEMGFIVGQEIESIKKAPLQDPVEYRIMGYDVSLRNSEADMIEIESINDFKNNGYNNGYAGIIDNDKIKVTNKTYIKEINIALVGNPNCGKTTIFNYASGSKERVGNYSGVTVESKEAKLKYNGYIFKIVDLPGTYSLSAYSPEELYVRDYIINHSPDIVLNIIDGSNLERNLYLTTQLIDMDIKVVAALNMYDELVEKGDEFDYRTFSEMTGIPIIPTVGSKGKGFNELFDKLIEVYEDKDPNVRHIHINYGLSLEKKIDTIQNLIYKTKNKAITDRISTRFLAIKLLEKDKSIEDLIHSFSNYDEIISIVNKEIKTLEHDFKQDSETLITDAKYGFIAGALKETLKTNKTPKINKTKLIDNILTHKFWGIPIFLFFMWVTFFFTFTVGSYPMQWIEDLIGLLSDGFTAILPDGIFNDLIVKGILAGTGSVLAFLPNIVFLYMFISIMEDSGYMSRAVFIMDKAMHKIGLHGKSFIPLLMGFGCNVPAIMSSRIIESKKDRLVTMLINPFMSCSARLTVFVLLISAFFDAYQSFILFSLYIIGIVFAVLSALLLQKIFFKNQDLPFVMELPPYRFPTVRTILKHMWFRAQHYLKKVGGVILIASIIIWALGYFPRETSKTAEFNDMIEKTKQRYESYLSSIPVTDKLNIKKITDERDEQINDLNKEKEFDRQENSFIGRLGMFILPVMEPLGFDWKMSISLLAGISAKEVVVGTMGVLYHAETNNSEDNSSLVQKLKEQTYTSGTNKGQKVFNPLVAFTFMIFILLYFPCVGVISAIRKESGKWKWALFSLGYSTLLAWVMSLAVYNIGKLFL